MIVTFHSKDHYPITMFGEAALQLIEKMGCTPKVPGAIYAEDVPQALWQLQQNLEQLTEAPVRPTETVADTDELPVSLQTRAIPLLEMLRGAAKKQHIVSWD